MIDYIQQIKNLRGKLANGFMSLMVGSGFSKNVHSTFPDWREMIFDMADELYGIEIRQSCPEHIQEEEKGKWINETVLRKIDREGYLQVVSSYIRLKGMQEAVVNYIEARTPVIQEGDQFFLLVNGEKELLTMERLHLHRALLNLPWNNIYTTNYDPLLECCVNIHEFGALQEENIKLNEKSNEYSQRLYDLQLKREELVRIQQLVRDQNMEKSQRGEGIIAQDDKKYWEEIVACDNEMTDLRAEKKDTEENIRINENFMKNSYTLVKNSSELSVKKNRNIIKLHGSLRSKEERELHEFGFDGDPKKQYVISGEHYSNYPKMHEAFTQLMRISLLQESFCLIGFSGVDPNFLSWIDWVRDLLQRWKKGAGNDYKIYFLDLSDKESTADQLLYFENHRIVRIPVLSTEIMHFLEAETNKQVDMQHTFASVLELFFQFLEKHPGIIPSAVRPSTNRPEREWERQWKAVTGHGHNFEETEKHNLERFQKLDQVYRQLPFPEFSKTNYHLSLGFLIHLKAEQIDQMEEGKRNVVLTLALRVLEHYKNPVGAVVNEEIIQRLVANKLTRRDMLALSYRNNTLMRPDMVEESLAEVPLSPYEAILRAAYSLQYDLLLKKLNEWNPDIEQMHLKAGFLAWYTPEEAEKLLHFQLSTDAVSEQQKMLAMEMLSMITRSRSWQMETRLEKKIEQYEQAGYSSIANNFSFFKEQLLPQPPKVEPYGNGRYINDLSDEPEDGGRKSVYARQNLVLLAETAFPVRLFYMNVQDPEHWYRLFKRLHRDFPMPCIFYSLQFSDEDLLRRIGQDICYNETLTHESIIRRLMPAYRTIPEGQRESLLLFLSQLMTVCDPDDWQNDFLEIWRQVKSPSLWTSLTEKPLEVFVRTALQYTMDPSIICEVVDDLLHMLPALANKVISHLYYLNSNVYFRQLAKLTDAPKLKKTIDDLISALVHYPDDYFFLLGNLYFLLQPEQIQKISEIIQQIDLTKIKSAGVWRIMLHFVSDTSDARYLMKNAIQQHENLWQTGIHGNSYHAHSGMLHLSELTRSHRHPKGLDWTDAEIIYQYEKMKPALKDLSSAFDRDFSFVDFTREWEELNWFLSFHKGVLEHQPDYNEILVEVNNYLTKLHGFDILEEGLYSDLPAAELSALSDLAGRIEDKTATLKWVNLVVTKLLMKAGSRLEESLEYVSRWLRDKRNKEFFEPLYDDLTKLLKLYLVHPLKEADRSFVESHLVIIALSLKDWGHENQVINDWIGHGQESRFNSTRQRMWLYKEKKKQQEELL